MCCETLGLGGTACDRFTDPDLFVLFFRIELFTVHGPRGA